MKTIVEIPTVLVNHFVRIGGVTNSISLELIAIVGIVLCVKFQMPTRNTTKVIDNIDNFWRGVNRRAPT